MRNPNSVVYASYNMPTLREPLTVVPTGQRLPEMQSSIHLEKMANAGSRNWEPNYFNPITFPLNHGNQAADQTQSKLPIVLPQSNPLTAFTNVKPVPPRPSEMSSAVQMTNLKPNPPSSSWSVVSSSLQSKQPVPYGSDNTVSPVHYQNPDKGSSQSRTASDKSQSPLFEGASNYNTGSGQMQTKSSFFHSQSSPPDLLRRGETSHAVNLKPTTSSASWSVVPPSLQSKQPETSVSDKAVPPVKYLKISSSKGKIGSSPLFERGSNYNTGSSHLVSQTQPKPVDSDSNQNIDYTSRELVPPSQRGTSHAIQKTNSQPSHISMIPPRYQSKMPVAPGGDHAVLPVKYQKPSSNQGGIGSGNYSTDTGSNLLVGFTQRKQSIVLAQSNPQGTLTSHGPFSPNLSGTGSGSQMADSKQGYASTSWPMASPSSSFEKPLIFGSNPAEPLSKYQRLDTGSSQTGTGTGDSSTPLLEGASDHTNAGGRFIVDPVHLFQGPSRTRDSYAKKLVSPSFDQSPLKHYKPNFLSQSLPVATSLSDVRLPVSGKAETPVSAINYQKSQYDYNPSRGGLDENPNLPAGQGFYNSGNRGTLSGLGPKPMPVKPPQKSASPETGSWHGQGNFLHGSSNTDLWPQKNPMKLFSDLPESKSYSQSNFIAAGPSTAFASPMWETTIQSPETQANEDWMFPTSGVFDNWNLAFPQVGYQLQNSPAKIQKDVAYQPASGVPVKKRIVHSRNGYKRERIALSKAAYNPKYDLPLAQDTMANPFKRLPQQNPQPVFKF